MDIEVLELEVRDKARKSKSLRRDGFIPAEYYGNGVENMSLQVEYQTFRKLYRKAGENTVIELHIGDDKKKANVLVHRIDLDPVTDEIVHIDFINVRMDEEVHTNIPLNFVGTAPAVKELAGILNVHYHEVEVKCLPKDLVHGIDVDITSLVDFSVAIHFSDLVLPAAITMVNEPELTVVSVSAPRIEKEPTEEEAAGSAADVPEVGAEATEEKTDDGGGE